MFSVTKGSGSTVEQRSPKPPVARSNRVSPAKIKRPGFIPGRFFAFIIRRFSMFENYVAAVVSSDKEVVSVAAVSSDAEVAEASEESAVAAAIRELSILRLGTISNARLEIPSDCRNTNLYA